MSRPESGPRGALGKLSAVLLSLGIAAPASAQLAATDGSGPIRLRVGEQSLTVSLKGDTLRGGGFALKRTGSSFKGRLRGGDVDLGWRQGPIIGRVGVESTRLELSRMASEQGLRVDGELASWSTSLVLSPLGITGTVGGCDYSMTVAGGQYTGWRTCQPDSGGEPTPVTLSLPETIHTLNDTEQATLVALLLSANGLPPAPPRDTSGPGRTLEGPGMEEGPGK